MFNKIFKWSKFIFISFIKYPMTYKSMYDIYGCCMFVLNYL